MSSRSRTDASTSKTTSPASPPNPLIAISGSLAATGVDVALIAFGLGGLPSLLSHPRALTLLVIWFAGGLVLSLARPVRTHDPIATAAEPKWTLPALLVVPLFVPALSAWGEARDVWPIPGGAITRWGGVILSGLGFALRIAAIARLGSRFSPLLVAQRGHALETSGLYAIVRHPGYLGTFLVALGTVIAFGSAVGLILVAVLYLLLDQRMRREDAFLESQFGDTFRRWRERTGRFLPRLTPLRG